jgi:hypothetical protein
MDSCVVTAGDGNRANGHPVLLVRDGSAGNEVYAELIRRLSGRRELQISCKALLYKTKQMGLEVFPSDEL